MSFTRETFTRETAIKSIVKNRFQNVLNDIRLYRDIGYCLDKRGFELVNFGGYVTSFEEGFWGGASDENYAKYTEVWKLLLTKRGFKQPEFNISRKKPLFGNIDQLYLSFRLID